MANEFILTRSGEVVGRVRFDWVEEEEWTIRNVRLDDFTDQALRRKLERVLTRNEPRLKIAGGHDGDLARFYEGLQAALWWLKGNGGGFDYTEPAGVKDRVEDPLADY